MGGLEAIDGRFRRLYERAVDVLGADDRVSSVELGGSVGAGTADEWSDLDLTVATDPERHEAFVDDWPNWLAEITPTVFARTPIAPFIVNAVTDEGLTLDVAIWPGAAPEWPGPPHVYTVGLMSSTKYSHVGPALEWAVAEQLRGLTGPFISLLQRDEHLRHLTGIPHLVGLLTTVFLAETGAIPPGKHWNGTYTEEQRAAVSGLPAVRASYDDILLFGLALAELLLTRARPLFHRYDLVWPAELAHVTARRLLETLGVDVTDWLH